MYSPGISSGDGNFRIFHGGFREIRRPALVVLMWMMTLFTACASPGGPNRTTEPPTVQHSKTATLPPAADFFRPAAKKAFSISPDGTHVAWLAAWNGHMNLYAAAIFPPRPQDGNRNHKELSSDAIGASERITSMPHQDVENYYWTGSDAIVFLADVGGDGSTNIFTVPTTGGVIRDLTPFSGVRVKMVAAVPSRPDEILVAMNQRDPSLFDVYRLTLSTGQARKIADNPGSVVQWTTDHDGNLRAAVQTDGLRTVILYRDLETETFRPVFFGDARTHVSLHGFTFDNRELLLVSNRGRDKDALIVFDPTTETEVRQLYAHPEVDILAPLISPARRSVEGAVYITERVHYAFFNAQRKALQTLIDQRFPGLQAGIADRSLDEKRLLIMVSGDRRPGAYYVYDAPTDRMGKVADLEPWINPESLAAVKPVVYPARDGRPIHGYLTVPAGKLPRNLPVVVLPHGDPWVRDVWGYDPEAQFLASRGYGVFQPNFRGSSGYGRAFKEAGFRQWGIGVMQHDITDGVRWLAAEGIADPKRVAIYGTSYGGYAAIAGLTFTPELYAAGVSHSGPVNLFSLIASFPLYMKTDLEKIYMEIGDPRQEPPRLIAASPYFHADQILSPLLVAEGAVDPRVPKTDIDAFVYRLRRRGIPVAYMVKPNEGHVFRDKVNQTVFYQAVEAFLARYLGGRSATPAAVLAPLAQEAIGP